MPINNYAKKLIDECAGLNSRIATKLKGLGLDYLVWSSPTSFRDPEICRIWHNVYTRRPLLAKFFIWTYIIFLYSILGCVRFFTYRGFWYKFKSIKSPILLLMPIEIANEKEDFRTSYIIEDTPISKLIFSQNKNIGNHCSYLDWRTKLGINIKFIRSLSKDLYSQFLSKKITIQYIESFLMFLRWVISNSWFFHWDFYYLMHNILRRNNYRILLCLHEMHFYSKTVWYLARKYKLKGVTAQHAMIIPEKLWYFPQYIEIQAGSPIPDVFFVYSGQTIELLRPYYPRTKFYLVCSPRFSQWKELLRAYDNKIHKKEKSNILFVSGIMFYDVKILIRAIKRLLKDNGHVNGKIKFRLHPYANIQFLDRIWIKLNTFQKNIDISNCSLKDDLYNSKLVIGINSTVLQEATLIEIPTLAIYDDNFMHSSIFPDFYNRTIHINDFSWAKIKYFENLNPETNLIDYFRQQMGLQNIIFSTNILRNL